MQHERVGLSCKLGDDEPYALRHLAKAEKINHSYVRRILRLTLLSPEITEAILDGSVTRDVQLEDLVKVSVDVWAVQGEDFGGVCRPGEEKTQDC